MEATMNRLRSMSLGKGGAAVQSDVTLNTSKFAASSITPETKAFTDQLIEVGKDGPIWTEVGAEKYRQMRWNGETPLPKPVVDPTGINSSIPSRDAGRTIPTRAFTPSTGPSKGVFLHIHGGGWVLQSEHYQDPLLRFIADETHLTVVSVGYRLAPEDPWPAGVHDCYDAATWLVDHAHEHYGAPLLFAGGESAGAHLSVLIAFHLIQARPMFVFQGLVLNFGCYSLDFLPSVSLFKPRLVLWKEIMDKYLDALLPGKTAEERRHPSISPLYADLDALVDGYVKRRLPPALFTCGTADCLLDDTSLMSLKWQTVGEATVKYYPGGPHGLVMYPRDKFKLAAESQDDLVAWVRHTLG